MSTRLLSSIGILALAILPAACGDDPTSPQSFTYSEDFTDGAGFEWSNQATTTSPSGERFLGTFNVASVSLSLPDLPAHSTVTIEFDFHVMGSWNGTTDPDLVTFTHSGGTPVMVTNFANQNDDMQSWPQSHPGGSNARAAGSFATNSLGYDPEGTNELADSSYRIAFTIPHTASTFRFQVAAQPTGNGEVWGIDNVEISIH